MKKYRLSKLAILGITSGLFLSSPATALANLAQTTTMIAQLNLYDRGESGMTSGKKDRQKLPARSVAQADKPKKPIASNTPQPTAVNNTPTKTDDKTAETNKATDSDSTDDDNAENVGYHLMSEDELKALLNKKSAELFDSLDQEGKDLALKVASGRCNGTNECAGLNACETPDNKCAGLGSCKGKGKCAFADKNLAVKLVAKKMAEKRMKSLPKN